MTTKLGLKWKVSDEKGSVLIFDKAAWAVFQATAEEGGIDTDEMILAAVVKLVEGARYQFTM